MKGSPRVRVLAAALLAGVVVIGAALAVTAPWQQTAPQIAEQTTEPADPCPAIAGPSWSVARRWDEALLDAIRRSLPNPPAHARNLFHLSVAMWDAWAAYDPTASGVLFTEKPKTSNVTAARNEAMSYAAYRVLSARFIKAVGADRSLSQFADLMDTLCLPIATTTTEGNSPAAVGNRIAKTVLDHGKTDGSNELGGYAPDPAYTPVNPPL